LPKEIDFGMCGPLLDPEGGQKIAIDDRTQALGKPAQRWTEIGGRLTPDVASVRVSCRRDGRKASGMAVVAQVAGELQAKLHQPTPFGFFDLRIRGEIPWRSIRVQAYDDAGAVLEAAGPASSAAHHGHGRKSSTTGGFRVPQPQIKFSRRASNGYSIFFEANRGRASLRVQGDAGGAVYSGKSSLVDGRMRFGLGKLGRIDVSSATVGPPKPFSGTASFVRNIDGSTEWSGTLSVALPGAQSTALTGPAFEADLAKPRTAGEFSELLGLN
jgi:hypothetical protein